MPSRPPIEPRALAHALASASTVFLLSASITNTTSLDRLLWSVPHMAANLLQLVLLTLAMLHRPRDIDESGLAFVLGVLGALSPLGVAWCASWAPAQAMSRELVLAGRYLNLVVMPFYLLAMWTLGRSFTILPEASRLETGGVYSVSRHPLYATYLYWFLVQNLIFQSWAVLVFSAVQVAITVGRARLEEGILARNFPSYREYRDQVWWFGRRDWVRGGRRHRTAPVG